MDKANSKEKTKPLQAGQKAKAIRFSDKDEELIGKLQRKLGKSREEIIKMLYGI